MKIQQLGWVFIRSVTLLKRTFHLYKRMGKTSFLKFYRAGIMFAVRSAFKRRFPQIILINMTNDCNLSCEQCFIPVNKKGHQLSYPQLRAMVEEAQNQGTTYIGFTGGEPFLREHELIDLVTTFPKMYFLIYSNGILLRSETIRRIQRHSNLMIFIGIDGPPENTEERRGIGNYRRIKESIAMLSKAQIPVGVSIMITRENIEQVTDHSWIKELEDIGCLFMIFVPYAFSGKGMEQGLLLTEKENRYLGEQEKAIQRVSGMIVLSSHYTGNGCLFNTGRALYIDASAELGICPAAPFSNTFYQDLIKKALAESSFLHKLYKIHKNTSFCLFRQDPQKFVQLVEQYNACSYFNEGLLEAIKQQGGQNDENGIRRYSQPPGS